MRCFEHDLRLGETPIGELRIDVRSRDDIPALLLGLQHLYMWCQEELETLSRRHVTTDRDPENGRLGMTLWRVLVMAVLKQGLDCDYDRLGELVNHHRVVRQLLQHGYLDEGTYSVRTLRDNVSLVTPVLLRDLNALLVREGHAVVGKPPGTAQWHSFSEFCHSVKDSVLGLGYPLIFYSVSELPVPVLPFFAATFRPVFGIAAHRTGPDGAVADTGRSRRPYEPRFPGGRMPAEVAGSRCWPPPPQVHA